MATPPEALSLRDLDLRTGPMRPASLRSDHWWMELAIHWSRLSIDRRLPSGCVAVRESRLLAAAADRLPGHAVDSLARRKDAATRAGMRLSAPLALVCEAARNGISLKGSRAFVYPALEDAHSAAALIDAGCIAIVAPHLPTPMRLQDEMRMVTQLASENGVHLQSHELDPLLELTAAVGTFDA